MLAVLIMLLQQVLAKIIGRVAPDGMDVIGVVLSVVQFDKERRRLNPVIMRLALGDTARPSKVDIPAGFVDLLHSLFSQVLGHIAGVFFQKSHEGIELPGVHLRTGEA